MGSQHDEHPDQYEYELEIEIKELKQAVRELDEALRKTLDAAYDYGRVISSRNLGEYTVQKFWGYKKYASAALDNPTVQRIMQKEEK